MFVGGMTWRKLAIASLTACGVVAGSERSVSAQPDDFEEPKTLKERLSDKASDEQRVDNCKVALARRGATPRPDCDPKSEASQTLPPRR